MVFESPENSEALDRRAAGSKDERKEQIEELESILSELHIRLKDIPEKRLFEIDEEGNRKYLQEHEAVAAENVYHRLRDDFPETARAIVGEFFLPSGQGSNVTGFSEGYSKDGMRGGGTDYRAVRTTHGDCYIVLENGKVFPYEFYEAAQYSSFRSGDGQAFVWALNEQNRELLPTKREVLMRWVGKLLRKYAYGLGATHSNGLRLVFDANADLETMTFPGPRLIVESPMGNFGVTFEDLEGENFETWLEKIRDLAGTPTDILPWAETDNYGLALRKAKLEKETQEFNETVAAARQTLINAGFDGDELEELAERDILDLRNALLE